MASHYLRATESGVRGLLLSDSSEIRSHMTIVAGQPLMEHASERAGFFYVSARGVRRNDSARQAGTLGLRQLEVQVELLGVYEVMAVPAITAQPNRNLQLLKDDLEEVERLCYEPNGLEIIKRGFDDVDGFCDIVSIRGFSGEVGEAYSVSIFPDSNRPTMTAHFELSLLMKDIV